VSVSVVLGIGAFLVLGGVLDAGASWQEACSQASRTSGECPSITTTVDGAGVTLGATQTTPGSAGTTSEPSSTPLDAPWSPPPVRNPVLGSAQCTVIIGGSCRGQSPPKNPPEPVVSVVQQPTAPRSVSDLVSFAPDAPGIVVEPGTWSLPRLETNIYSSARSHTRTGELLGWPIEVRFSPQVFRWNYGDGSSASHAQAGRSWGAAQFSASPTGHVYRAPGVYAITLQVDYSVAYRFGDGPFVPVSGTVTAGSGPIEVRVLRVTPVLVDHGCAGKILVEGRCEGN
jgi:hypothetical protein